MPERVQLDDREMRARLRPLRHAADPAAYVRRPVPEPSHKLFQDIAEVHTFQFPAAFSPSLPLTAESDGEVSGQLTAPDSPLRQILSIAPRKPEPSRVLRRESFVAQVYEPQPMASELQAETFFIRTTPQPELHRSFEPPAKPKRSLRIIRLAKAGTVILKFKRRVIAMPLQQRLLTGLAALVLLAGTGISLSGMFANHAAKLQGAQASLAPATTTNSADSPPSTAPVTSDTLRAYNVAPDAARYISIPKLGVMARVLQVGLTKDGSLATPSNVADSAWYKQSAKPGQPGATLIDGHVSSWTTNGVFYDIKGLVTGDTITIERGDGKKLNYSVVKTTAYPADAVDMASLMKPVTAGKSGLNLITCGGKYDSKSGEFTQRVAVYATLND